MSMVATSTLRNVFSSNMCMLANGPRASSFACSDGTPPPAAAMPTHTVRRIAARAATHLAPMPIVHHTRCTVATSPSTHVRDHNSPYRAPTDGDPSHPDGFKFVHGFDRKERLASSRASAWRRVRRTGGLVENRQRG